MCVCVYMHVCVYMCVCVSLSLSLSIYLFIYLSIFLSEQVLIFLSEQALSADGMALLDMAAEYHWFTLSPYIYIVYLSIYLYLSIYIDVYHIYLYIPGLNRERHGASRYGRRVPLLRLRHYLQLPLCIYYTYIHISFRLSMFLSILGPERRRHGSPRQGGRVPLLRSDITCSFLYVYTIHTYIYLSIYLCFFLF